MKINENRNENRVFEMKIKWDFLALADSINKVY
jgi:hypothetical protein